MIIGIFNRELVFGYFCVYLQNDDDSVYGVFIIICISDLFSLNKIEGC